MLNEANYSHTEVHGNAGSVSQGWRTDTYRALASAASGRIHVLAFDYRGFALSTGSPDEQGLITDGVAVVDWALNVAKIPPDKIVLVGQSLGTAVATAVAEYFSSKRQLEFAGLVLVAGFSDLPTLLTTYAVGGVLPILSPLRNIPRLQQFFAQQAVDRWPTVGRLARHVKASRRLNLVILHAQDDLEINYKHSDLLFFAAANATSVTGLTLEQVNNVKIHEENGMAGWSNSWFTETIGGDLVTIKQTVLRKGGKAQ